MDFIKNNTSSYLKLLFRKFKQFLHPREPINDQEYVSIEDKMRIFKIMFLNLWFIMPFAFLGIFLGFKRLKEIAPLYLILVSLSAGIILFFIATRYRMTIVPYLCIFASLGIYSLWGFLKEKRFLKFTLASCLVLSSLFFFYSYDLFSFDRGRAMRMQNDFSNHLKKTWYYLNISDYQRAMQEAKIVYQIQPDNIHILLCLGKIHYHTNNFKKAEEEFKEAMRIFPLSFDAYYNLGLLYNCQNRFDEARQALEKAVHLDPEDMDAHFELGKCYKAKGEPEKAKEEFNLALK
jgi:tetratricopeptide (TPR) repeat protein